MQNDFVEFNGEENEKQFLEKCLEQWEKSANSKESDMMKLCQLGLMFSEMRHRIDEIE